MRQILKGQKANIGTKVDGSIVTVQHVTLNKPTKRYYELSWKFDFSNVSQDQLLRLAARGLVIDQRPKFKSEKQETKLQAWDNRTFKVSEILAKERARKSVADKAQIAVAELSNDDAIKLLMAELAKRNIQIPAADSEKSE